MEKDRERARVWRVLAQGPAHGTTMVFVSILFMSEGFRAPTSSCASETGSLMRQRGGGSQGKKWRKSRSDQGITTGRNSAAANPPLFFNFIYIISSLPHAYPLPLSNQLFQLTGQEPSNHSEYVFTQNQRMNALIKLTQEHFLSQQTRHKTQAL